MEATNNYESELATAIRTAKKGGALIRNYFEKGTEIRYKESYNLVSDADLETEELVVSELKKQFPNHLFLGEESHKDEVDDGPVWIIDPLDGTNNFAHHIPHFAISIALFIDRKPVVGVVLNPITGDLFRAVLNQGAYLNDKPIEVSKVSELKQSMIATGFYYDRGTAMIETLATLRSLFEHNIHGIRRYGTASLDLSFVACGRFDAYFEFELQPWDFAAGLLIVEEAGGKVTNCLGEKMEAKGSSILASNGSVHTAVQELVEPRFRAI